MEETSEQRRERLRSLREQALSAGNYDAEEAQTNTSTLPPFSIADSSSLQSSASRFEYYTDPLVAYTGYQKKKTKLCMYPSRPPCPYEAVGSPVTYASNPNITHSARNSEDTSISSSEHSLFPGETVCWHRPSPQTAKSDRYPDMTHYEGYGHNRNPNPNFNHNQNQRINGHNSQSNFDKDRNHNFRNPNINHTAARFQSHNTGFRSPNQYSNSSSSPSLHFTEGRGTFRPQGSFHGSPFGMNRGRWSHNGGRGFQNFRQNRNGRAVSSVSNPESFAKRSMVIDPWKDLVPVCIDQSSESKGWLPKSIRQKNSPPCENNISISGSGPSLFDCLSASVDHAVHSDTDASGQ